MNSFIRTLFNIIKSKMTPIVTKIRFFLTPQFWRTKVISKFRTVFSKIFNVRPKDKDDYYGMGRYLVSKRLAYAVVLVIGVLSLVYIVGIRGMLFTGKQEGIKSYKYSSWMLRLTTSDKVIITGESGYQAYIGAVEKGAVTGRGQLYDKDGNMVYQGEFVNNMYSGKGSEYYDTGVVKYTGDFVENLHEGEGKLYRKSGTIEYNGAFSQGLKDGEGKLYDAGGNQIYQGSFSKDQLLYFELLGKTASEVRENYLGAWRAYENDEDYCLYMQDIDALYEGSSPDDSVESEVVVDTVYVLKDTLHNGRDSYKTIDELRDYFGEPLYQGNSMAILPEAVIIDIMSGYKKVLNGKIDIEYEQPYTEYCKVTDFDSDYPLYLYSFEKEGVLYTFFCKGRNGTFDFYSVMSAQKGEIADEEG